MVQIFFLFLFLSFFFFFFLSPTITPKMGRRFLTITTHRNSVKSEMKFHAVPSAFFIQFIIAASCPRASLKEASFNLDFPRKKNDRIASLHLQLIFKRDLHLLLVCKDCKSDLQ